MGMLAKVVTLTDLSFVHDKQNLWAPRRTGDYATDTAYGRRCADELIGFMRLKNCHLAFGQVMRAITAVGKYEAVEIGFCHRIGVHVLVGQDRCTAAAITAAAAESANGTRATRL
jgi:hypothetical protein